MEDVLNEVNTSTNILIVNEPKEVNLYQTANKIHTILVVICFSIMCFGIFKFLKSLFRK